MMNDECSSIFERYKWLLQPPAIHSLSQSHSGYVGAVLTQVASDSIIIHDTPKDVGLKDSKSFKNER